jgi:hypothetical protein
MSHDRSWHEIVFAAGADKDGPARFKYKELRYRITVGTEAISREEMAVRPGREVCGGRRPGKERWPTKSICRYFAKWF